MLRTKSVRSIRLAALLSLVVLGVGLPTARQPVSPTISARQLQPITSCAHPGNADFYVFGIRLGIYLQVFSTMLGMYTSDSPDMLYDFHDSNAVLLLAILIAIVKATPGRLVDLADVVILLRLMWLIVICGFSVAHVVDEFQLAR